MEENKFNKLKKRYNEALVVQDELMEKHQKLVENAYQENEVIFHWKKEEMESKNKKN